MPNKLGKDFKISIIIIFAGFLAAFAALYALSLDLDGRVKKIQADRLLIQNQVRSVGFLAALKASSEEARRYGLAMDKIISDQNKLFDFPRWVDLLAKSRGVTARFAFEGEQVPPQDAIPGHIGFSITTGGTISSISAFIKDLERIEDAQFLISLDSFDFSETGSGGYNIGIRGRVFFK